MTKLHYSYLNIDFQANIYLTQYLNKVQSVHRKLVKFCHLKAQLMLNLKILFILQKQNNKKVNNFSNKFWLNLLKIKK
jgi:hypothetical protein